MALCWQLPKGVQAQSEVKPKQKSSLAIYLFSFLWERKGLYLRSACSYERSKVERRLPLLRLYLATAKQTLSHALSNPTARERLLHYVQV